VYVERRLNLTKGTMRYDQDEAGRRGVCRGRVVSVDMVVDVLVVVVVVVVVGFGVGFERCRLLCLRLSLGRGRSGRVCEMAVGGSVQGGSSKSTIGQGLSIMVGVLVRDELEEAAVR
jgi:hypothetical protein